MDIKELDGEKYDYLFLSGGKYKKRLKDKNNFEKIIAEIIVDNEIIWDHQSLIIDGLINFLNNGDKDSSLFFRENEMIKLDPFDFFLKGNKNNDFELILFFYVDFKKDLIYNIKFKEIYNNIMTMPSESYLIKKEDDYIENFSKNLNAENIYEMLIYFLASFYLTVKDANTDDLFIYADHFEGSLSDIRKNFISGEKELKNYFINKTFK